MFIRGKQRAKVSCDSVDVTMKCFVKTFVSRVASPDVVAIQREVPPQCVLSLPFNLGEPSADEQQEYLSNAEKQRANTGATFPIFIHFAQFSHLKFNPMH